MGRGRGVRAGWLAGIVLLFVWAGAARAQGTPDQIGQWSPEETWARTLTHAHLLPTGQVMFMGEFSEGMDPPLMWDPLTSVFTPLAAPPYNIFCAGMSFLGDGTLLLTGGHDDSHIGVPYAIVFDPFTLQWTQLPDMNDKRWYPTTTTLADGRGITLSGETDAPGTSDELPQIWDPDSWSWVNLTNALLHLPYYPRTFVAPNGRLFMAGPQALSRWLDVSGAGAWYDGPRTVSSASRTYGSAVMYEPGKVLIVGGGEPPLASAEVIDLNAPTPVWTNTDPMHYARRQLNATLLPDGRVLVTGGSYGDDFDDATSPVLASEVWDPSTGHWTEWASAASYHGYHSTATLLPDGRILMGGGRKIHSVQVFSPPYLFKGARPTISSAPQAVMPGQAFFVGTPDAASVAQATLVRLGATTHAFNMNQRFNRLAFTQTEGGLTVTAPANNDLAPPGHYLLFLINGNGVPSVAKVIQLGHAADPFTHPIVFSDTWRFDDSGADLGTDWLAPGYDDSGWSSGTGVFGVGGGDVATSLEKNGPTVYFRKQITVNGAVTSANLDLLVDDGAAVFVNGVQVFAQNMGGGTSYAAFASAAVDDQFVHADLNTVPFVQGVNTIAVELKNASSGSPDLTFALALNLLVDPNVPPPPPTVTVTSPNGSETLARGASEDLVWNSSGAVASVDLAYSLDSGATWTPIVSGLANVGHYTWTVPDLETTTARVRVSSSADPTVQDSSDADFAITRIVSTQVTAIPLGASWKYWDEGTDPGMMWNRIDFDDSAWSEGDAQLGYGGHGEVTRLTKTSPAQSSVLFRKQILAGDVSAAQITTLSDDGIAVYVNGALVFSKNCDRGLDFDRYASASTNNEVNTFTVPSSVFLNGVNQIAVMVKQVGGGSPDLEFDLALTLTESDVPPPPPPPAPTLTLTGPNGGELLAAGSSADLTWSNTGTVANVDLAYSLDSGGTWIAIATNVPNGGTYAWTVPAVTTSTARVRVSATADGTVADASDADFSITQSPVTQVDAIPLGDTWKYWDSGVDPGAGWNLASFDDAGWSSGAAQLGYGGHGEVTTLTRTSPSQSSVLFRKQLTVSGAVTAAQLHVLFDDGIAVYVNGTLVYDQNCDRGLTFDRYASASTNNEEQTVDLPGSVFQDGVNQIAVMVKQVGGTSPDLAFDLSLALTVAAP